MTELMRWKEPAAAINAEQYSTKIGGALYWLWDIVLLILLYNILQTFSYSMTFPAIIILLQFLNYFLKPQLRKLVPCSLTTSGIRQSPIRSIDWEEIEMYFIAEQPCLAQMRTISILKKKKKAKWYQPDLALNRWQAFLFDPREVDETKLRALLGGYVPQWPADWASVASESPV